MSENQVMLEIPEVPSDAFAAQPSQGMNRSADQVRASMRVYLDSGRVSEEGVESLIRLFNVGKSRGYSFDQTGELVEYSGATMSRLFAGKYDGNLDKVVAKIDSFLDLEAEREKMRNDLFIENSIWESVRRLCDMAIRRNAIVRLVGPSQIGKTYCLREYARRAKFQVCYVRVPAAPTFKLVVDAVCQAVGVNSALRVEEARLRVAKAVGRNTLLIIDELHELVMSAGKGTAMKCMEWIREIWDNAQCGMVLCGTRSMEDDLINDSKMKGWLVQIDQRCIRVKQLPNRIPVEDVMLAGAAYGITGGVEKAEAILQTIRMNRLTACLTMTASWCDGNNRKRERHPKTWESFVAVYKATFEEAN